MLILTSWPDDGRIGILDPTTGKPLPLPPSVPTEGDPECGEESSRG